jgi:hypothetical protein
MQPQTSRIAVIDVTPLKASVILPIDVFFSFLNCGNYIYTIFTTLTVSINKIEKYLPKKMGNIDNKSFLEISVLLLTLITFIYKVAQTEMKIFETIDRIEDNLSERQNQISQKLSIHIAECEQKEKNMNFCFREVKKQLDFLNTRIK